MKQDNARQNMIQSQIRPMSVQNDSILTQFKNTPRELFVPDAYRFAAFSEWNIPLGHQQVMMRPYNEARLLQALSITKEDNILEIGTGSGYLTALLARLGKHVCSVDIFPEFTHAAQSKLSALQIHNVSLANMASSPDFIPHAPFDVICITASLLEMNAYWLDQLADPGRLFAIIGTGPSMRACLFTKQQQAIEQHILFDTWIPPLLNTIPSSTFLF
jgi:protein-L-isoaspartate(D-aspartate) O-methyltransferase